MSPDNILCYHFPAVYVFVLRRMFGIKKLPKEP